MKIMLVAGVALAAVALSGCQGLGAVASFNKALAPNLKPLTVSIKNPMKCSDLADRIAAADSNQVTPAQYRAAMRACEEFRDNFALDLDPQAARDVVQNAIKAASAPSAVVTKAAGLP